MIFTAIVATGAVVLYLLAGRCAPAATESAPAAPSEIPASAAEADTFASVPEDVYVQQVVGNDAFLASRAEDETGGYALVHRDARTGSATLTYTVREGLIESVTLTFPVFVKPPAKPKTDIERSLANTYRDRIAAQNEAIRVMLPAVLSACDLNDVLPEPILLRWYAAALTARDEERTYSDAFAGCAFSAYPTKLGAENVVVCSLLLP